MRMSISCRFRHGGLVYGLAVSLFVVALSSADAIAEPGGFLGEGKCGSPTCHGAAVPARPADAADWLPARAARTLWMNHRRDHHSRAYETLTKDASARIAKYMGITATKSEKCLVCHAPAAPLAAGSTHEREHGVTCEHCHGPAETWIEAHVPRDWPREKYPDFYDNEDFVKRARNCARCHVEIDHEIVAGGHPPLQFEMVAYASVMRHWNDRRGRPKDAFSVDPTLWSVGQVVGLRRAVEAIVHRAGKTSYQGLAEFPHFTDRNCYECHHKLVADGMRQAEGHYAMVDTIVAAVFPADRDRLQASWKALRSAVTTSATDTENEARELADWLAPFEARIVEQGVGREPSARILRQLLVLGESIQPQTFDTHPPNGPPGSPNVVTIENIDLPWWYTTGAAQQVALALGTLCEPVYSREKCLSVEKDLDGVTDAASPFAFDRESFVASLASIRGRLPAKP